MTQQTDWRAEYIIAITSSLLTRLRYLLTAGSEPRTSITSSTAWRKGGDSFVVVDDVAVVVVAAAPAAAVVVVGGGGGDGGRRLFLGPSFFLCRCWCCCWRQWW